MSNYMSVVSGTFMCMSVEMCVPAGNGTCRSTEYVAFVGMDEVMAVKVNVEPDIYHVAYRNDYMCFHFGAFESSV